MSFVQKRPLLLLCALALVATACLSEDGGGGGGGGGAGGEGGGSVEIFGGFSGEEAAPFEEELAAFAEESGIDVEYNGVPDFDTLITTRVQGGDLPDIAVFPQPGLLLDVAEQTDAVPVEEYLDLPGLEESLIPGFLDAATSQDGTVYGFPIKMAVKSVLWYPIPEFEEAGYTVPETHEDLVALEEQIRSDGGTPWCLGMESGDATGWVGTDWVEEYMLRLHGPDVYDQWVNHEIPFDSPEVQEAWEAFGERWQTEGNVVGGAQGVLSIPFGESPHPMFDEEPGCWMHRQGNFATAFFPEDVQADLDANVGAAYFPAMTDGFDGSPVLGAGDLAMLLVDSEEARQVMEFLASEGFGETWAEAGGFLSPQKGFDTSLYPTEAEQQIAAFASEADVFRFDASDLMPGAVGAGTFWTAMVDWVSGESDLPTALANVEQSWPASSEEGGTAATETEAGGAAATETE